MPEPDFMAFERDLLQAGVAPRHARRTADEIADHYAALVGELECNGCSRQNARIEAAARLGDLADIRQAVATDHRWRCWYYRWPLLGKIALPLACLAALPLSPVVAGVQHAGDVARWGACLLLGGLITASLFGVLQATILFS